MIVSIHQPGYLPWHGLFHRMALSDVHILLDTVQFEKHGFNNRVKIRGANGPHWLTVPVLVKGRFGNNRLADVEIEPTAKWRCTHLKAVLQAYAPAPHFAAHAAFFSALFETPWTRLLELNLRALEHLASALGVSCRFVKASELAVEGEKSALVLNLCRAVGARVYLSGVNGRDYLDRRAFDEAGIGVRFQAYREPHYEHVRGFVPYMSAIDLLFNHGPASRAVMMAGQDTLETGSVAQ